MLLRSSSTPVLGSLLSSFSDTPNGRRFSTSESPNITTPEHASIFPHCCGKLSFSKHAGASQNLTASPSVTGTSNHGGGFRRAQSDGNLEALAGAASSGYIDDFNFSIPNNKKLTRRPPHFSTLEAIPSFSYQNCSRGCSEDEEEDSEEDDNDLSFCNSADVVENLCFKGDRIKHNNPGIEKEETVEMYIARGLGISELNYADINGGAGGGGGGGQGYRPVAFGGDGDSRGFIVEEHYKKMLEENPGNPLCLRNYAQFLHQTKKDLPRAEEYYSRAILADPTDGEVLCQYAKLVWELYHDFDRTRDYFERAIQAAGEDSNVQAAYACFLWETADDDVGEDCTPCDRTNPQLISTLIEEGIAA